MRIVITLLTLFLAVNAAWGDMIISPKANKISLTTPNNMTVGDADQTMTCTSRGGSSWGASPATNESYTSNTTSYCTIASNKLHAVAAGTCTVTAADTGGVGWGPATQATSGNVTISAGTSSSTDNFNRASLGANWTTAYGVSAPAIASSTNAESAGADTVSAAFWNATAYNNNQYSQAKITSSSPYYAGVMCRASSGNPFNGYQAVMNTSGNVRIRKITAGTNTLLSDVACESQGKVLKLSCSGTTTVSLQIYADGSACGSAVTDSSSPITGGQPGIWTYSTTAGGGGLDDWEGGNL